MATLKSSFSTDRQTPHPVPCSPSPYNDRLPVHRPRQCRPKNIRRNPSPRPREATAALVARSLFPVEIGETVKSVEPKKVRRVSGQLLSTTFAQLADLLHSGVPLLRSLEVIQKQTSQPGLKQVLDEIHHQVEEGSTLADAMNRFPRIFNDMSISMIRAGGEGGFLEEALTRVAQFTEAQEDMKKRTLGRNGLSGLPVRGGLYRGYRADRVFRAPVRRPLRPAPRTQRTPGRDRLAPLVQRYPAACTAGGLPWS